MSPHPELVESEQHLVYLLGVERVLLEPELLEQHRAQRVRAHSVCTAEALHAHRLRRLRSARTVVRMETETTTSTTTRQRVLATRRIVTALLLGAALAVAAMAQVLAPSSATEQPTSDARADVAAERAAALITAHDCWTGEAPADMVGQIPGHVVVRKAGAAMPRYSAHLVGPALDHVFSGKHAGMTVYGFCR